MSVFTQIFGPPKRSSREVARSRLELVLLHDRVNLSPQLMQQLKDELIVVISRYVEIDEDGVEVSLTQNKRQSRLTADIPVVGGRRRH
jgi:cell division topological specificity factor